MKARVLSLASAEWIEAVRFYEGHLPGLGKRLSRQVQRAIEDICDSPRAAAYFQGSIRRKMVKGWPYGILYEVLEDHVLIVAVMHDRRKPGYWSERLG